MLAEIGKRLGRKGLQQVARVAKPDTILGWYRQLVAKKFDGSKHRGSPGRPRVSAEIENLVLRLARESSGLGYDFSFTWAAGLVIDRLESPSEN